MELDEHQIAEHIRRNPPSCIAGFRLAATKLPRLLDDSFTTVYRLSCKCGSTEGAILGYPLKDYNAKYEGTDFITPLSFKCSACGAAAQIIDTKVHGYHAEVAKIEGGVGSVKLRGEGLPFQFACPECAGVLFTAIVGFVYWDFDIMFDEPELPGQEFFHEFLIYGECRKCNKASPVSNLGKL